MKMIRQSLLREWPAFSACNRGLGSSEKLQQSLFLRDLMSLPISCTHLPMWKISAAIAGFLALTFVMFATLSPIDWRPTTQLGLGWEHILAFAVIAALWAYSFPRYIWHILVFLVVAAILLEAAQFVVPGRHGRLVDAAMKILGVGLGVLAGRFASRFPGGPKAETEKHPL